MEAIGTLAGGIAHDFNNILAAIMGYTEIAVEQLPKGGDTASCLQEVLKATLRAKTLVQQILAFSRKSELERMPVSLAPVVRDALKLLRATLPTTIDIQQLVEPDCWPVVADQSQMHQVMLNLCTNAAHAMEEKGGTLTVLLRNRTLTEGEAGALALPAGDYLLLVVSDTGRGMEQSVRERIFEPYFTTKEQGKGAGMGLSVVHGIVKSHGGAIVVESEAGQGATFRIFFPRATEAGKRETSRECEETATPSMVGTERILVVDDEEAIVALVKMTLERQGYQVTPFTDSEEALRIFSADPQSFDLVITDQTMPHLPGTELAKALLAIRADLPIILCSGYSSRVSEADVATFGVSRYLMKPVEKAILACAVREVLDQQGAG
jgi:CheY-like chemotaxis protein